MQIPSVSETSNPYKQNFYRMFTLFLLVLLVICVQFCNNRRDKQIQDNLISALNDSMITFKDQQGLSHSERQIIETGNPIDFLNLKTKDIQISNLQAEVAKYKKQLGKGGSVTLLGTSTTIDTSYVKNDNPCEGKIFKWEDSIKNKWIDWEYSVLDKNVAFHLTTRDSLSIVNKQLKQGWFKRPKYYSEVTNFNPYSSTKSLITYKVVNDYKSKNFHVGPAFIYGIGDNFKIGWFAGVGVMWTPLNF